MLQWAVKYWFKIIRLFIKLSWQPLRGSSDEGLRWHTAADMMNTAYNNADYRVRRVNTGVFFDVGNCNCQSWLYGGARSTQQPVSRPSCHPVIHHDGEARAARYTDIRKIPPY